MQRHSRQSRLAVVFIGHMPNLLNRALAGNLIDYVIADRPICNL